MCVWGEGVRVYVGGGLRVPAGTCRALISIKVKAAGLLGRDLVLVCNEGKGVDVAIWKPRCGQRFRRHSSWSPEKRSNPFQLDARRVSGVPAPFFLELKEETPPA